MSFNRTHFRAVIGVLSGHNTLRRHFHRLGLTDSPLCRKCGVEEETSAHTMCKCVALVSFRHVYLGSFFSGAGEYLEYKFGVIWNIVKTTEHP